MRTASSLAARGDQQSEDAESGQGERAGRPSELRPAIVMATCMACGRIVATSVVQREFIAVTVARLNARPSGSCADFSRLSQRYAGCRYAWLPDRIRACALAVDRWTHQPYYAGSLGGLFSTPAPQNRASY